MSVNLEKKLNVLEPLLAHVLRATSLEEKLEILNEQVSVKEFLAKPSAVAVRTFLGGLTAECDLAIKSVLALGQGDVVFFIPKDLEAPYEQLRQLLVPLVAMESFYANIGGIVGYHCTVLRKIVEKHGSEEGSRHHITYHKPKGIDLNQVGADLWGYVHKGITGLEDMAELYPIGGAGDRLDLHDEATGMALPGAKLPFLGRTLLEGLIRDLQAREYVFFKLYGRQVTTPVAMMTSQEKDNHRFIMCICEDNKWFGRPRDAFMLFEQPLIPTINVEGDWCLSAPLHLILKPGGHGVMWKLAHDKKVFAWMRGQKRRKMLIRQINNPIASQDYGLLGFTGIGIAHDKAFGFASCPRTVDRAEGMNVLIEDEVDGGYSYSITNVEYTEFALKGIHDVPETPGATHSAFPANTNILFADIETIDRLCQQHPVPGMLINMKNKIRCMDKEGHLHEAFGGRLESTMQNIADYIQNTYPRPIKEGNYSQLSTFLTYYDRRKTISVTKKSYTPDSSMAETPEGCFFTLLTDARDVLVNFCKVEVPAMPDEANYLKQGPSFLFTYHPALGPLYNVIGQKVRGGKLSSGAELALEIATADLQSVSITGSLRVTADSPIGHITDDSLLHYSEYSGRCRLINVTVINKGIDKNASNIYWKNQIARHESVHIVIQGNGEFEAIDVTFRGNHHIVVAAGTKVVAREKNGQITLTTTPIQHPSWQWTYRADETVGIKIEKVTSEDERQSGGTQASHLPNRPVGGAVSNNY